jgi:hypothetical protein
MRTIPLSRGLVALVDDEDYERVTAMGSWSAQADGRTFYARKRIYQQGAGRGSYVPSLLMHVFILGCPGVDHRNGDGLDNQRANLRPATHSQNMGNKRLYRNSTSGFKGVTRNTGSGRPWRAAVKANSQRHHLGYFDTAEAAARAYDAAARELFGEFARPNFPEVSA